MADWKIQPGITGATANCLSSSFLQLFTVDSEMLMLRLTEWCLQGERGSAADAATEADGGHPADRGRRVAMIYSTSESGTDRPEQRGDMPVGNSGTPKSLHTVMCDLGICFEPLKLLSSTQIINFS